MTPKSLLWNSHIDISQRICWLQLQVSMKTTCTILGEQKSLTNTKELGEYERSCVKILCICEK